ncbi:hypothetical protein HG530_009329 [Fusarium avenaceum]|nr:hypothetical protein HG530_009329 [Fusarium avenaceum]
MNLDALIDMADICCCLLPWDQRGTKLHIVQDVEWYGTDHLERSELLPAASCDFYAGWSALHRSNWCAERRAAAAEQHKCLQADAFVVRKVVFNFGETVCYGHTVVFSSSWAKVGSMRKHKCLSGPLAVDVYQLLKTALHQLILVYVSSSSSCMPYLEISRHTLACPQYTQVPPISYG